jgi:hypothetical protein
MVTRLITDEDIEKVTTLMFRNQTLAVKKLLMELPELKEEEKKEHE